MGTKRRGSQVYATREVVKSTKEAKQVTLMPDNLEINDHLASEMKNSVLKSHPVELLFAALVHKEEENFNSKNTSINLYIKNEMKTQ